MPSTNRPPDAFYCEAEDLRALWRINSHLFGVGSHLTPDSRRDLANWMFTILARIEKMLVSSP